MVNQELSLTGTKENLGLSICTNSVVEDENILISFISLNKLSSGDGEGLHSEDVTR